MQLRLLKMAPGGTALGGATPMNGIRSGQFRAPSGPIGRLPMVGAAQPSTKQPFSNSRLHDQTAPPALGQAQAQPVGFPTSGNASWQVQATEINLTVFEPQELRGYAGAFVSVFILPNPWWQASPIQRGGGAFQNAAGTGASARPTSPPKLVAEGRTDKDGKYFVKLQAPTPTGQWYFKIVIASSKERATLGVGGTFETQILDVPATTPEAEAAGAGRPGFPAKVFPMAVVCPAGTDPLVCEVARLQVYFLQVYHLKLPQWATQPGKSGDSAMAMQSAHGALDTNVFPKNPDLAKGWPNNFSWGITDLTIPPKDWPALLKNYWQLMDIWNAIPFPEIEKVPDLFKRCAKAIPITTGKQGQPLAVNNFRLFAPGYSNYFPRSDKQIRKDLAARYIMNIPAIWACMEMKIQAKAREIKKKARYASIVSLMATLMLGPMAGGAGFLTSIATELSSVAMQNFGQQSIAAEGITAAVAAGLITSGDPDLVIAALKPLLEAQTADLSPEVRQAVNTALPKIVGVAVQQINSNLLGAGAQDFGTMSGPASAIMTALVKALAGIPKMVAANQAKAFGKQVEGFNRALYEFQDLLSGQGVPQNWKPFLVWVIDNLGLDELMNQVIDEFIHDVGQSVGSNATNDGSAGTMPDTGAAPPPPPPPASMPPASGGTPPPTGGTGAPPSTTTPPTGGGSAPACPTGQFWDGKQCRGSVSSFPPGTGTPYPTTSGMPSADCPSGVCLTATPQEPETTAGQKAAVVLTVGAAVGAAAILLFATGLLGNK